MRGKIEDDKTQWDSVGWERIETRDIITVLWDCHDKSRLLVRTFSFHLQKQL